MDPRLILAIALALVLSGCTPFWMKPDTTANLCTAGPIILAPVRPSA